ncbi:MAG: hypothetical protein A2X08_12980 [Bacteroidetes bacterium GWA2_32_17]|nr:MAG: hypothetical protein A2X08_12980 [Bacteroidetes bacterium GWA2_32_17]
MKLLFKTSIYFLISSIIVYTAGSIIFYFLVRIEINREIDEVLVFKKGKIIEHIKKENTLPNFNNIYDVKVIISSTSNNKNINILKDTMLYNELKSEYVPYRALTFTYEIDNQFVKIQLLKSFFEIEDLIKGILTFILLLILFLLLALFVLNIFISQVTFKPFYNMLHKLQNFDITKNKPLDIGNPKTFEFIQLKNELLAMTNKARNDYKHQKEFIENASHEIQTPLAVIKAKCELLLQSNTISEVQTKSLLIIIDAVRRLSTLNYTLLLITKIENKQFQENENIDVQEYIEKHLLNFEELISLKNIKLSTSFIQKPIIRINSALADILISNLLNNAIKHNIEGGAISIKLSKQELVISNTGSMLSVIPETLFNRFFKDKSKSDSLGLGLTIVKKITDLYQMKITYCYENGYHEIKLIFPVN